MTSVTTRRWSPSAAVLALLMLAVMGVVVVPGAASTASAATVAAPSGEGSVIGPAPSLWPHNARDESMTYVAFEQRGVGVTVQRIPHGTTTPDHTAVLQAPGRGAFGGGRDGIDIGAAGGNVYVSWLQMWTPDPDVPEQVEVWLAVSRDRGASFGDPIRLSTSGGAAAWGPRVAAAGDRVAVVWGEDGLRVAGSIDAGDTFTHRLVASHANSTHSYDVAMSGGTAYAVYLAGDHLEVRRSAPDSDFFFSPSWVGAAGGFPRHPVLAATSSSAYVVWSTSESFGDGTYTGAVTVTASVNGGAWGDYVIAECARARQVTCNSYDAAVHDDRVFFASNTGSVGDAYVAGLSTKPDGLLGQAEQVASAFNVTGVSVAADDLGMYVGWAGTTSASGGTSMHVSSRLHLKRAFVTTALPGEAGADDVAPALTAGSQPGGSGYGLAWMRVTSENASPPLQPTVRYTRGAVADGDLEVISAEAVQGPYRVERLAAGKPTVAQVKVRSGLTRDVRAYVSLTWEGAGAAQETVSTRVLLKPGANTFFLPESAPFTPDVGALKISAHVDPTDEIEETDETNNESEPATYRVKETRAFRVLVVPLKSGAEAGPTCAEVQTMAEGTKEYVSAAFPLDPDEVSVDANCASTVQTTAAGPWTTDPAFGAQVLSPLNKLNAARAYDVVIGVVRAGWFADNWRAPGALGISHVGVNRRTVVVDARAIGGPTAAHEILHDMGWAPQGSPGSDPNSANHLDVAGHGYWVERRQELIRQDFMYFTMSDTGAASDDRWISPGTWDFLMDRFADNPVDPPLVFLDGTVSDAGAVESGTWYETDGFLDSELGDVGDLEVRYRGADGTLLGTTAIAVADTVCLDGETDPDCTRGPLPFWGRIPDVAGTRSIELVRDNAVLYTRQRSQSAPTVRVTSPTAGESVTAGAEVNVTWDAADADGDELRFAVAVSTDGGTTWRPMASDVQGTSLSVRAVREFSGADLRVRVSASDGWNTTHATSGSFAVRAGVSNGDLVFLKSVFGDTVGEVWRTDASGTDKRLTVYNDENGVHVDRASYPDWSPDGTRIAFLSTEKFTGRPVIRDMDRDGGDRRQLASSIETLKCLDWSPDGKRLLALRGMSTVVAYDVATATMEVITTGVSSFCPRWSPDGKRVVFSAPVDSSGYYVEVFVVDVSTGVRTMLTSEGLSHGWGGYSPAFSPDGDSIAYLAGGFDDTNGTKVWLMNADGSNPRVLGPRDSCATCPAYSAQAEQGINWSPDGESIQFTYYSGQTRHGYIYDVWSIPASGGAATRLTVHDDYRSSWAQGSYQPVLPAGGGDVEVTPPVVADAGGPYAVVEGGSVALDASGSKVAAGTASYAWDLDGDGQYDDAADAKPSATFPGSGEVRVAVRVADEAGASATATAVVRVSNAAPVLSDLAAVAEGTRVSVTGLVTDAGSDDTHEVVVEWADGTTTNAPLTRTASGSTFYAGHSYSSADAATGALRVVVKDTDNASADRTVTPVVAAVNTPPTIADASGETREDVPLPLSLDPADADGDALTLRVVDPPAHGEVLGDGVPIIAGTGAQLTYVPEPGFSGTDTFTVVADDGRARSAAATVTVVVKPNNTPPSCADLRVTPDRIWWPNLSFVPVTVSGATDADGDVLTTSITGVTQDEVVGTEADARRTSAGDTVQLRAERDGRGDGRVYRISVEVSDGKGGTCTGVVMVQVPHDEYGKTAVDSGGVYDSFRATPR